MSGLTALVPLDGTELSESAFALLPALKNLNVDRVRLLSVWEESWAEGHTVPGRHKDELGDVAQKGRAHLDAYLGAQAEKVEAMGFKAETEVRIGKAAEHVLEAASEKDVDLIVIATHGRSGMARWRLGSVADKIVRSAPCPALVLGPNVEIELLPYALQRILVPVDGSEMAALALSLATWIGDSAKAELDLVRVVSLTPMAMDQSMGVYPVDLVTAMEDAGRSYLDRVAEEIGDGRSVSTTLLIGSAVEQLLEYLKEKPASLVILASHGRSGVARAALGSVADRLLHGPAPVLVFRPDEEEESRLLTEARNA